MPAIRDWSFNYNNTTTATSITCEPPLNQAGDLLIAICTADTGSQTWSATGWTQKFSATNTANIGVLYKYSSGSETTFTFNYTVAESSEVIVIAVRDTVTSGDPFDVVQQTLSSALAVVTFPQVTTVTDNCMIFYACSHSAASSIPSILGGGVTQLASIDPASSAHNMAIGWTMKRTAGATANNVQSFSLSASAGIYVTFAIKPPSGGATVIPTYCASDSSLYLTPLNGTTAYNGDTAFAATATTHFGTTLNGTTLANGTATARPDVGLNSYHSMADCQAGLTSTTWYGCTYVFATANKPNVAGKNIIFNGRPFLPVDLQTTTNLKSTGVTKGVALGLASTSNTDYRVWHVSGAGTPWGSNLQPMVINDGNTSGRIQNTGTLNNTSILALGFFVSGFIVNANWIWGSIWALDTTVVAGGSSTEPIDVEGIVRAAAEGKERMSIVRQGLNQMLILQPIQIGDGGTNGVYLKLDGTAIEFPQQYNQSTGQTNYCSVDNVAGITYYAGASDTIIHKNSVISSASKYHWKFHPSSSTSATYDFSGLNVIGAGTIELLSGLTITGVTINGYGTILANGAGLTNCTILNVPSNNDLVTTNNSTSFTNCDITVTGIASGNRWISVANPSIFTDCTFNGSVSSGHAIRITAAGTYTLDGNIFNNFGADGTNSAAIFNDSGGTVTLNIIGGGNTPTVRNGTGASTTVNNPITITVSVSSTNNTAIKDVNIYIDEIPVSAPSLAQGKTNSNGEYSVQLNLSLPKTINVRARKRGLLPVELQTTIQVGTTSVSIPITMSEDPVVDRNF
jgi:hypothetical protein